MRRADEERLVSSHSEPGGAEVDDAVFVGVRRSGRWVSIHTEYVCHVGREVIVTGGGVYSRSDRFLVHSHWPPALGEAQLLTREEAAVAVECLASRLPASASELCLLAHQASLPLAEDGPTSPWRA